MRFIPAIVLACMLFFVSNAVSAQTAHNVDFQAAKAKMTKKQGQKAVTKEVAKTQLQKASFKKGEQVTNLKNKSKAPKLNKATLKKNLADKKQVFRKTELKKSLNAKKLRENQKK